MASKQASKPHPSPGCCNIDLGSESTRATICYEEVDRKNRVHRKEILVRPQIHRTHDTQPDFLSLCNVVDRGAPYIGNEDVKRPNTTTLKLGIAWATSVDDPDLKDVDASLRDCPLMNVFKDIERKGSDEVASAKIRVKQACEKLFEKVAARAQELCKAHQIDITTFILTIPPNWKIEVEEYYSSLIKKAFDPAQDVEILFVFEVEALARYLFHDDHACRTIVNDRLSAHRGCKFLIVDFGGFTFNSSIYHVEKNADGRLCFSTDGNACGVTGGSAHFSHLFREACVRKAQEQLGRPADDLTIQNIELEFDRRKLNGSIDETSDQIFEVREVRTALSIILQFEARELYDMWSIAHRAPLQLFGKMVKKLARMKSPGACVVVSGGSSRHQFLKAALKKICAENKISEESLVWIDAIEAANPDSRLTVGMAYTLDERISVTEYFRRGGAWSFLQMIPRRHYYVWESVPRLLWSQENQNIECKFSSDGINPARIVGTPFGDVKGRGDQLGNHYVLFDFDVFPKNDYILTLQFYENEDNQDILDISIFAASSDRALLAEIKLPLRYDMGSNCVLLDVSEEEMAAEWKRIWETLKYKTCGDDNDDDEEKEDELELKEARDDRKVDPDFAASRSLLMNSTYGSAGEPRQTRGMAKVATRAESEKLGELDDDGGREKRRKVRG